MSSSSRFISSLRASSSRHCYSPLYSSGIEPSRIVLNRLSSVVSIIMFTSIVSGAVICLKQSGARVSAFCSDTENITDTENGAQC